MQGRKFSQAKCAINGYAPVSITGATWTPASSKLALSRPLNIVLPHPESTVSALAGTRQRWVAVDALGTSSIVQ